MTNCPGLMEVTALPASSTTPQYSWPIGVGCSTGGVPRYGQRSEPQTQVAVSRRIASVGCVILGAVISSKRTSRVPCKTAPSMCDLLCVFLKHAPRDRQRCVCGRPSRVESEVRDDFDQLVFRDAVVERPFQMERQLVRAIAGDERCDGDETPIARAETGAFPDVAEQHFVGVAGERRGDIAKCFPRITG